MLTSRSLITTGQKSRDLTTPSGSVHDDPPEPRPVPFHASPPCIMPERVMPETASMRLM